MNTQLAPTLKVRIDSQALRLIRIANDRVVSHHGDMIDRTLTVDTIRSLIGREVLTLLAQQDEDEVLDVTVRQLLQSADTQLFDYVPFR